MVGILDYGLAKVADLVIKYVISPAVNYGSPVSFVEESVQNSENTTEAILKIVPSQDPMVYVPMISKFLIAYCVLTMPIRMDKG